MKKFFAIAMIFALSAPTFQACRTSKSSGGILGSGTGATVGKTVATVIGAILLSKIINSVLKNVLKTDSFNALTQNNTFTSNFGENTQINSFANNDLLKGALQLLVSKQYQIPFATVNSNFNSLQTVGDLATFIGKNAPAEVLTQFK